MCYVPKVLKLRGRRTIAALVWSKGIWFISSVMRFPLLANFWKPAPGNQDGMYCTVETRSVYEDEVVRGSPTKWEEVNHEGSRSCSIGNVLHGLVRNPDYLVYIVDRRGSTD